MGAEKAEGLARTVDPSAVPYSPDEVGLTGRRARRDRAHEYWSARPFAVRAEERASATSRPAAPPPPAPVRREGPLDHSAAGLPMRVAPTPAAAGAPAPGAAHDSVAGTAAPPALAVVPDLDAHSGASGLREGPYVPRIAAPGRGGAMPAAAPAAAPAPQPVASAPAAPVQPATDSGDVDEALEMLIALAPHLGLLAQDRLPQGRITYARCHALLARMGRAVADREVWRALLGMCDADPDAEVRRAADEALGALEQYGTQPRG